LWRNFENDFKVITMKKIILTAIGAVVLVTSVHAQQGSWYIGGNAGYSQKKQGIEVNGSKTNHYSSSEWTFSPEIGTFLTNNLQLGLGLNGGGEKMKDLVNGSITKASRTGGTLYSRYFFGQGNFRPFLGVNVSVLPGTVTESNPLVADAKFTKMTWGANLNAGFAYALSSVVTAVGSFGALGYSSTTTKAEGSSNKQYVEGFGFENAGTLGNRFTIGIYYTFLSR
jgi:hypothetical protein